MATRILADEAGYKRSPPPPPPGRRVGARFCPLVLQVPWLGKRPGTNWSGKRAMRFVWRALPELSDPLSVPDDAFLRPAEGWSTYPQQCMEPVRIRRSSHHFATQSSHLVDRAGLQAKMASIEFWIP